MSKLVQGRARRTRAAPSARQCERHVRLLSRRVAVLVGRRAFSRRGSVGAADRGEAAAPLTRSFPCDEGRSSPRSRLRRSRSIVCPRSLAPASRPRSSAALTRYARSSRGASMGPRFAPWRPRPRPRWPRTPGVGEVVLYRDPALGVRGPPPGDSHRERKARHPRATRDDFVDDAHPARPSEVNRLALWFSRRFRARPDRLSSGCRSRCTPRSSPARIDAGRARWRRDTAAAREEASGRDRCSPGRAARLAAARRSCSSSASCSRRRRSFPASKAGRSARSITAGRRSSPARAAPDAGRRHRGAPETINDGSGEQSRPRRCGRGHDAGEQRQRLHPSAARRRRRCAATRVRTSASAAPERTRSTRPARRRSVR